VVGGSFRPLIRLPLPFFESYSHPVFYSGM